PPPPGSPRAPAPPEGPPPGGPSRSASSLLLQFVRPRRQGREARLQPVVRAGGCARPREQPARARREDLRGREPGGRPHADAAAARHELADRLVHAALHGLLALAGMRLAAHEGLSRRKLVTSSFDSVRAALKLAAAR